MADEADPPECVKEVRQPERTHAPHGWVFFSYQVSRTLRGRIVEMESEERCKSDGAGDRGNGSPAGQLRVE